MTTDVRNCREKRNNNEKKKGPRRTARSASHVQYLLHRLVRGGQVGLSQKPTRIYGRLQNIDKYESTKEKKSSLLGQRNERSQVAP